MKIIFLRHTESVANYKGVYSGRKEYPLTNKGKAEIMKTKKVLKELYNLEEFRIYSSPLKRCTELARSLIDSNNYEIIKSEELIEYNFGDFEGFSCLDLKEDKYFKEWCVDYINYQIPSGESLNECSIRINNFLKGLLEDNKDIIIVTHEAVIKLAIIYLLKLSLNENNFWKFSIKNGGIVEFEYNDGFAYLKNLINCNK